MKLSEAILLGDSLKNGIGSDFLASDGSCGCALGGALLACGVNSQKFATELQLIYHAKYCASDDGAMGAFTETAAAKTLWPWLTPAHVQEISIRYIHVKYGYSTLEQLVDYVRSIEPAEESTLPDLPLSEQLRLEENDAAEEGAAIEASNLPYPEYERNGR